MKKIPTVFCRDFDNDPPGHYVTETVNPGCEWVLAGEGRATRKFDGTCVLIRRDGMLVVPFMRREIRHGSTPLPSGFIVADVDPVTGKTVGWEPARQSGFWPYLCEAINGNETPGTYELCGPKINGNPERQSRHVLFRHGDWTIAGVPIDPAELRSWVGDLPWEGVVWHHNDGRMAKLKAKDIPREKIVR